MGQTQLLLIVLSVIIVGTAVAVGIGQLEENSVTANRDAVAGDCQRLIATSMQWFRRPVSLGGGGNTFTGLSFSKVGVDTIAGGNYQNSNGTYALTVNSATQITFVGTGVEKKSDGTNIAVTMQYYSNNDSTSYTDNM